MRLGIAAQLAEIDKGFAMIAAVPEFRHKPIVIGESDPDGCAACLGPQLGYRTGTMYSSYTAATFAREYALADRHGVNLEGALTWAFEFEDQPYFAGQRVLATNGIDLPVLNVFRMFSRMGGRRVATSSSEEVAARRDHLRRRPGRARRGRDGQPRRTAGFACSSGTTTTMTSPARQPAWNSRWRTCPPQRAPPA